MTRTLDLTPTWAGLVPAFRAILENGNPEGRAVVWGELARAAALADLYAAHVREQDAAPVAPPASVSLVGFPQNVADLAAFGYRFATRETFDSVGPQAARFQDIRGTWAVFDPSDDSDGFALVGFNPATLAQDAADALALPDATPAPVGELARLRAGIASAIADLSSPHYGDAENYAADYAQSALATLQNLSKGL